MTCQPRWMSGGSRWCRRQPVPRLTPQRLDNSDQDLIDQSPRACRSGAVADQPQHGYRGSAGDDCVTGRTAGHRNHQLADANDAVALVEGEIADLTLTQTEQEQRLTDLTTAEEALLIELQAALDELEGAQSNSRRLRTDHR